MLKNKLNKNDNMITSIFTNNNIVLFDLGENPYSVDYRRKHPDDFDEWGNYIGCVDDDDDD